MVRLVIVGAVLALLHLLLHRRLVRATGLGRRWGRVVDTILAIGWATALVATVVGVVVPTLWLRPIGFVGLAWMAVVFYLLLGLAAIGIALLVMRLLARFDVAVTQQHRTRFLRVSTALVSVAAVGTALYGVTEAAAPGVTYTRVVSPRLPGEFDGVRVAVVSDLHLGPARGAGFARKVVDLVNEQKPDVVVVLGDLADGTVEYVGPDLDPLADVTAPMGVYGVAGNHEAISDDVGTWMRYWEQNLGITPLTNTRTELVRGDSAIDVAGVYDYSGPAPYEPDLDAALAGRDRDRFVLLLAHQPNHLREAAEANVDLQLSGHTHGGQMWPLRAVVALAQEPAVTGIDTDGATILFTTYGAGAWGPPVRVAAPPEIAIIELATEN